MLYRPENSGKRRDGNTTRLVDYYIQLLFQTRDTIGYIILVDDFNGTDAEHSANEHLYTKFRDRFLIEFPELVDEIICSKEGTSFKISWSKSICKNQK